MKILRNFISLRFVGSLIAVAACLGAQCASAAVAQLNQELNWETDVEKAKVIAAQQDKLVLLHFGASWCRPCRSLETFVFSNQNVQKVIQENVVAVKLDADLNEAEINEFDVQSVPFDVVITPKGRVVSRRRSPADATNYALMISKLVTANRSLKKGQLANVGHQLTESGGGGIANPNARNFQIEGPKHRAASITDQGSLLQRRQSAFGQQEGSSSNTQVHSNPWVAPRTPAIQPNSEVAAAPQAGPPQGLSYRDDDRERQQFLQQQQPLPGAQGSARRVEPKRIVNNRYFEAIRQREGTFAQAPQATIRTPVVPEASPVAQVASVDPASDAVRVASVDVSALAAKVASLESALVNLELPANARGDLSLPLDAVEPPAAKADLTLILDRSRAQVQPEPIEEPSLALDPLEEEVLYGNSVVTEDANDVPEVLDRSQFCLYGKCPVTLVEEGRWADGDSEFGIVHRERVYLFASQEKLDKFKSDPDGLSPVLAGFDPVLYHHDAKLVDGIAENGVFMGRAPNHRVILFSSAATREKFQQEPKLYLGTVRQAMKQSGPVSSGAVLR